MSLGRCLRAEQSDQSLDLLAVRPNGGNSQHACGLLGLLRVLSSLSWGFLAPTLHLRELSPLLGDLCDFPIDFITDHCDFRSSSSFVGVTARGFGTNVHAVVWGRLDETKRPSPESRVSQHGKLLFWPGGGGDLLDAEQPELGYYIVGSWSSWSPEPMEEEEDGCFGFTVSLPQGTREAFQIWIDSNPGRALHPACTDASSGSAVHGPSSDHCDNTWLLQSRVIPQVHTGQEQSGFIVRQICDEFRIRLRVRGKWRLVDWQQVICGKEEEPCWDGADTAKVDTLVMAPATQPINSVYYVMGSPTSWAFEQMSCAGPGIYIAVLRLTTAACDFQIARNKDWEQVLHPSFPRAKLEDANPVLGPSGDGQGRYWRIDGQSDDLFRIELRHLVLCGKGVHEISWRRVMHKTWHAKR
ncbi:unnamed protein product [Polarella glacialis]|uniref:Uncharacterized protein n=1 Tax=Polarella glacialis TaxID=89957 RepID=A0A813E2H7_POLGL|nr:unnamed protein product [Polarella glacialis]